MPVYPVAETIKQLEADTRAAIRFAEELRAQPHEVLQRHPAPNNWSAVECLDHIVRANRHYIVEMEHAAAQRFPGRKPVPSYRSGWIGERAVRAMQLKDDGQVKRKLKAPAGFFPKPDPNVTIVLDTFIAQQSQWLSLLDRSRATDVGAVRIPTTISRLLTFNVGDTLRFLTAHTNRHLAQARRALR